MRLFPARGRDSPKRSIVAFLLFINRDANEDHARPVRRQLRIADPDEVEEIFLGDVSLFRARTIQLATNDRARTKRAMRRIGKLALSDPCAIA